MQRIAQLKDETLIRQVADFFRRPQVEPQLVWLARRLPGDARVFVAGGAIRNLLIDAIHGGAPPTRDLDIFIGGLARDFSVAAVLDGQRFSATDLKGLRWHPDGSDLAFDLCLMPDFLAIATGHLDPTPENLLTAIDFSANAIIYDVGTRVITERGCAAAIRRRTLAFNGRIVPDKRLMAYRILLIAHKTGFVMAEPVFRYVRERLDPETLMHLKRLLRAKRGRGEADVIMAFYDRLCRFSGHAAYRAEALRRAAGKTSP